MTELVATRLEELEAIIEEGLRARSPKRTRRSRRALEPTDVYVLRDRAGDVLYVGISLSLAQRMGAHRTNGWWDDVASIDVDHLPSRETAATCERALIALHAPPLNRNRGGA